MAHRQLPMFILDVLRYDIEQISNIVSLLNNTGSVGWRVFSSQDFEPVEVYEALRGLIASGLVGVYIDLPENEEIVPYDGEIATFAETHNLWFRLTSKGWKAWDAWEDFPTDETVEDSKGDWP